MRFCLISLMKKASLLSMLFLSVSLFPGCVTSQQTEVTPPSFNASGYDTLRINARKLEIIENWQMPMEAPHIEHMLEPTMSGLVVDWASRILVPIGGSGELILTISKASVTVGELAKEADFVSLFKNQQESEIKVELKAHLMWIQPIGNRQGTIEIDASTSRTVPESATPNDYDVVAKQTMLEAIAKLDKHARTEIAKIPRIILP